MVGGCDSTPVGEDPRVDLSIVPLAVSAGPGVAKLSVVVSAPDIASDLLFNIELVDGVGHDTLRVPAGEDRQFVVEGSAAAGMVTHRGQKTVDVVEGMNPVMTVALSPVAGDQPVIVALGGTTITVTPSFDTTRVGLAQQLRAHVAY
jgi:hypothetical protein